MNRGSLVIREATAHDADAVVALARTAATADGKLTAGAKLMLDTPAGPPPDFGAVLADAEFRTLVALDTDTDEVVGLAVTSEDAFSALLGRTAVYVHYMVVTDNRRQRGVGRELLSAVTRFAEEIGAENVVIGVWTEAREVNRYFAKVGFTPVVQRRIAPVSTLRRTLGLAQPTDARTSARRRLRGR